MQPGEIEVQALRLLGGALDRLAVDASVNIFAGGYILFGDYALLKILSHDSFSFLCSVVCVFLCCDYIISKSTYKSKRNSAQNISRLISGIV